METKRNSDKCRSIGAADQLSLDSLELGALGVHLSITPAAIHPASLCFLPAPSSRGNCVILFLPSLLDQPSWGASVHHTHGVGGLVSAAGGTGGGLSDRMRGKEKESNTRAALINNHSRKTPNFLLFLTYGKDRKNSPAAYVALMRWRGAPTPE